MTYVYVGLTVVVVGLVLFVIVPLGVALITYKSFKEKD